MADDIEMDQFLEQWLEQVKSISIDLTPKEQAEITKAGAKVMAERLTAVTNAKHRSRHDDKTYGHAADHVSYMDRDVDGEVNGASTVGWDNHYHAMNIHVAFTIVHIFNCTLTDVICLLQQIFL